MSKLKQTNETSFLRAFYSDGYKIGMKASDKINSKEELYSAIGEMYREIDGLIYSLSVLAENQNNSIHCNKGCHWCCHQPVFALNYELDYLNYFIKNNLEAEKQQVIQKKAQVKMKVLEKLNKDEILNSKHPCPLLEDDACSAYHARPMACRIYLSTNLQSCLKFFNIPNDKKNFPALLDFPMQAGRMMNEGFKSALKTSGYKVEEYRIEERLL
jgi:Fe-S-cluster containining protein